MLLTFINIILLYLLYWFLSINNFNRENFIEAAFIFIIGFIASAYLVLIDTLEPKESLDKKLTDLTREMLHEINIPIATIKANLQMLTRTIKDEKNIKKLTRIEQASNRLHRLYEILSYSIKKEIMPITPTVIDLKDIIEQRVENFKLISNNNFILELTSLNIEIDKIGLEQVIDNIIENAIKYSNINSDIEISINQNSLYIKDYGCGIEPQELVKIYDRYYQSDSNNNGSGIGLNIVKEFCDRENIELKINSKVGIGTTVIFDFSKRVAYKSHN